MLSCLSFLLVVYKESQLLSPSATTNHWNTNEKPGTDPCDVLSLPPETQIFGGARTLVGAVRQGYLKSTLYSDLRAFETPGVHG